MWVCAGRRGGRNEGIWVEQAHQEELRQQGPARGRGGGMTESRARRVDASVWQIVPGGAMLHNIERQQGNRGWFVGLNP